MDNIIIPVSQIRKLKKLHNSGERQELSKAGFYPVCYRSDLSKDTLYLNRIAKIGTQFFRLSDENCFFNTLRDFAVLQTHNQIYLFYFIFWCRMLVLLNHGDRIHRQKELLWVGGSMEK